METNRRRRRLKPSARRRRKSERPSKRRPRRKLRAKGRRERPRSAQEGRVGRCERSRVQERTNEAEETTAKDSEGSGMEDLKAFAKTLSCERLGGLVAATLGQVQGGGRKRVPRSPNSPELVRSARPN